MAKKKIDPLNKKQYGAVKAMLTVSDVATAVNFYQRAFGFSKRGIMNGPDAKPIHAELPIEPVEGCRIFELYWKHYAAYLVTQELVGSN